MAFDRRIILFAILAVVAFALTPVADDQYDYVPPVVGTAYTVLALLFLLDWWSRHRATRDR